MKESTQFRKFRAREELKIRLLIVLQSFKSKEEKGIKLDELDKQIVLAEMLARKLNNKRTP